MNRTVSEYRAARSVELALQGLSFDEIAVQLGFADRSGAWRAAQRCLARRQRAAADQYIATSLMDLEIIEEQAWKRAAAGDLPASRIVLRVIEDRLRLIEVLSTRKATTTTEKRARAGRRRRAPHEPETGHFRSMVV